jgi:HPt (histidine-containing phosphotransfer) domain-containing protein
MIDRQMLEEQFGKEASEEILDLFIANVAETLDKLESAINAEDNSAAAAAAHEITGTASSVGSEEMATCARQLEIVLSSRVDPRAANVLAHLKQLFAEVKHYIHETGSI